jgi:RNA-directed DNA polymerase
LRPNFFLNATSHYGPFCIGDLSIRSKERGFQEINLSDYGKTGIIGYPELPSKVVNLIIPKDQDASNQHSYGFRRGKSCKDALRRVDGLLKQAYKFVADADIKGYFDSIPQDKLNHF